jgi:hypothetical protein
MFSFVSSPGDYIGGGSTRHYSTTNATFNGYLDRSGRATVHVDGTDGAAYRLDFIAPAGRSLTPGTYDGALRAGFQGTSPGLSVTSPGRSCNTATGRFVVHTVEVAANGFVRRFHASFEQFCDGLTAGLRREVAFVVVPMSPPPPTPSPSVSSLSFVSEPGDYVGMGQSRSWTTATARFQVDNYSWGTWIWFYPNDNPNPWFVLFSGANSQKLTPGIYENAIRTATATQPGFSFSGDGRGCNILSATMVVHQINYDSEGRLDRLQMTFEEHCETATPALRGEIIIIGHPPR